MLGLPKTEKIKEIKYDIYKKYLLILYKSIILCYNLA